MAYAEVEKTVDVSKEKLFKVITDYEKYIEFVDGMKTAKATRNADGTISASNFLSTMGKEVNYSITLKENAEAGTVDWTLVTSDLFKKNDGGWKLEAVGPSQTKVKYWLDVEFSIPIPGFILKGLVKNSLPGVVDNFAKRAKEV